MAESCHICGEVRPFRWMGGFHCSSWRAMRGDAPLRAESWPAAQSMLIQQQRIIADGLDMLEAINTGSHEPR